MEKDWEARFHPDRQPHSKPGVLTILALLLVVVFVLWAILMFGVGFQDSEGRPKNTDLSGNIRVYSISLLPFLLPSFLIAIDRKPRGHVLRIFCGIFLVLSAVTFLIVGGLSLYTRTGIPAHPDWQWIGLGLVMMSLGVILIRPLPWTSRRQNHGPY